MNYQITHVMPVVLNNLSGYDAYFCIKDLSTNFEGEIKLLLINKGKYISFTKFVDGTNGFLRFINFFRFMEGSLNKLAYN